MTTKSGKLIALARDELDDLSEPQLWSDAFLIDALDEAQCEAARRARLFLDSTTTEVARLTLVSGTAIYALDPRVIRVDRARIATEEMPLRILMARDLDMRLANWEASTDPVTVLVPDWQSGKVRFVGIPQAAATVNLTVMRLPLTPVLTLEHTMEVADHHCRSLVHWIKHRAYQKRDSETYDKRISEDCLALFEREFGPPQPAYDEVWQTRYYINDQFYGHR